EDRFSGSLEYNADLFDASTAAGMACHFLTLLDGLLAHPERPVDAQPLLTGEEERRVLADLNATATGFPRAALIHHLFEAQARLTPYALAVDSGGGQTLPYAQLHHLSGLLAHRLRERGVRPGDLVGLCAHRSPDLIVASVAILRAGAAYVPLDPSYPRERL